MEKRLKRLLDYQKYARNPRMQAVIDSVHKQSRELMARNGLFAELVSRQQLDSNSENQ